MSLSEHIRTNLFEVEQKCQRRNQASGPRRTNGAAASSEAGLCRCCGLQSYRIFLYRTCALESTATVRLGKDLAQSWTTREILHAAEIHLEEGVVACVQSCQSGFAAPLSLRSSMWFTQSSPCIALQKAPTAKTFDMISAWWRCFQRLPQPLHLLQRLDDHEWN